MNFKAYFIAICGLVVSFSMRGQVEITMDNLPTAETQVAVAVDSNPEIVIGAADTEAQVWDYSTLEVETSKIVEFKSPLDTPNGNEYPLADMARTGDLFDILGLPLDALIPGFTLDGVIGTIFYGISGVAKKIYIPGVVSDISVAGLIDLEDLNFNGIPPDLFMAALEFGEVAENSANFTFTIEIPGIPIPIPASVAVEKTIVPDAFGEMYLPTDTFDVVRYHEESYLSLSVDIDLIPIPDTTIVIHSYQFFSNETDFPVAIIKGFEPDVASTIQYHHIPEETVVGFGYDLGCLSVSTLNQSEFAVDYLWDFGDGTTSAEYQPEHQYEEAGTYTVSLSALSLDGEEFTFSEEVEIDCPVIPDFSVAVSSCLEVSFENETQNGVSYTWDFGDGNSSTDENPTNEFQSAGIYPVTLTAIGVTGDEDSITQDIEVLCSPNAGFEFSTNCLGVLFDNTSVNLGNSSWSFGDGNISSEDSPNHSYELPGTYIVVLSVNGPIGGTDETIQTVVVDYCVGVENTDLEESMVSIYPVPASSQLTIETETSFGKDLVCFLYDLSGKKVGQFGGISPLVLDVANLNSGFYFVEVQTEKGNTFRQKVSIQK